MSPRARDGGSCGRWVLTQRASTPSCFGCFAAATLAGALMINLLAGCGRSGSPIPPEDVGVAAKLKREKQQATEQAQAEQRRLEPSAESHEPPAEEKAPDDVELPPLRPIGTQ